jgi:glycosyltransferase involved in cell wall biosynthesis
MPCLDEAETLATCIRKARGWLARRGIAGEVLVADNGSTDGSVGIALAAGARVVEVATRGYGAAILGGVREARGRWIIVGDADDSYDFSALDPFWAALRDGADLVVGDRFAGGIRPGALSGRLRAAMGRDRTAAASSPGGTMAVRPWRARARAVSGPPAMTVRT